MKSLWVCAEVMSAMISVVYCSTAACLAARCSRNMFSEVGKCNFFFLPCHGFTVQMFTQSCNFIITVLTVARGLSMTQVVTC